MDPNTRLLMMSSSANDSLAGFQLANAGNYIMVPYQDASVGYRLLFVDSSTGEVVANIARGSYTPHIYRFSNTILETSKFSTFNLRSIDTGLSIQSGNFSGSGYINDQIKFASDKLLTLGWSTSGSSTAVAVTFSVNSSTGLTQIASQASNSMGVYSSFYGMISNPAIAGQGFISSTTGLLTSMGTIATKAPADNSSSAPEARGTMAVNSSGTSFTFYGSTNTGSNFSRPYAGTGSDGYCIITSMDGGDARVFTGTSTTHGGSSSLSLAPSPNTSYSGFSPVAVLGSNTWLTFISNQVYAVQSGSKLAKLSLPNGNGATLQSLPGGAAVVYTSNSAPYLRMRKYSTSTASFGSEVIITKAPGSATSSSVNPSYVVTKIINY